MATEAAEVGSTASQYQILAKLAVGGMAEIFLVRRASVAGVERYCVLKRILRERARDAELVRMFLDEVRLAAQLQHPNIAAVYDIGVLGDSYFFTMEYVHGETIRSVLERARDLFRPLPLACVLTITAAAAAGLHHAHERKSISGQLLDIVHRDVSPTNLMVSFEGNVKVVDFGVAKSADRAVETQSGTVRGKLSYMSPEQCQAQHVDRRSDLFSLGIVMWEMLTGERLYQRTSDFDQMMAIVNEPPPRPSSRRPEIPRAIDDIVLRLLAKRVTERFQTAAELIDAIEDASLRAGMALSTPAVSRVMHDLFGVRPEPWLEFDDNTVLDDPVTLTTRSLLHELGDPTEEKAAMVAAAPPPRHDAPTALLRVQREPGGAAQPVARRVRRPSRPLVIAAPLIGLAAAVAAWSALSTGDGSSTGAILPPPPDAPPIVDASSASPARGELDAGSRGSAVADARPGSPPSPVAAEGPDGGRPPRGTPTVAATARAAEPRPASDTAEDRRIKSIRQLSEKQAYDGVVRACSAGAVTAAIASLCVVAACHEHDAIKAQRWLSRNPAQVREKLIASCQHLGNEDIHDDSDIPTTRR